MLLEKKYHGGAADVESMVKNEGIDVVVGGGKGSTGTVSAGTLLALGLSKSVDEAENQAKEYPECYRY